ncbi:hypothetical protein [Halapricum hydrolyticum]|uniref:DUF7978 domain-containing protein n=1 Tax=Halapricum hydrolyticum TaxID=2979991 RepID=A0AAE3IDD8_9EURY|nr:hypothetical protein [Halapricum hydrolyticum]MCU4717983.1 hypothetical protein [Halapricum hydrolyticum]MCU4727148.1 hypothetical protein [Halapricum hydrolyticum]
MDDSEDEPLFDPRITSYNWLAGVLGGVWTFIVGYLVMSVVALLPDGPSEGADPGTVLSELGRIFYAAHNVALEVRTIKDDVTFIDSGLTIDSSQIRPTETVIVDVGSTQPLTILGDNADQVVPLNLGRFREPLQYAQDKPELLYYLVPIVVLVVAGAVLASLTLDDTASIHEAVLPAIGLSVGYTGVAILGTFFAGLELVDGAILIAPSLGQTVVFALAYSLLCGLVGSYLIGLWRDRDVQIGALLDR